MDEIRAVVLAIIQGLTEFLPVSSSGHLILVPNLFGWSDQGLAFDVAVHLGTLLAVLFFFRHELRSLPAAMLRAVADGDMTEDARLGWAVIAGTLPVGLVAFLFHDGIETYLRSPAIIGAATAGFGVVLWIADRLGRHQRSEYCVRWSDVLVVGLAQTLALVPGTSRSGITITAGLAMGLTREGAARFSFLLSIPVILLAGGSETVQWLKDPDGAAWHILLIGVGVAGLFAYLCIDLFLRFLNRIGMAPFAVYRVILGVYILYEFY